MRQHYLGINPDRLANTSQKQKIDGIDLVVGLSPYTKPEGVTGAYDPRNKVFVISFDYFDNEPQGKSTTFNGVGITEGKYTGKLLSMTIPLDASPHDDTCIARLRTRALDALSQRTESFAIQGDRQLNQSVAQEVLEHDLEALVGTF